MTKKCSCMEVAGEDPNCILHGRGTMWRKENPDICELTDKAALAERLLSQRWRGIATAPADGTEFQAWCASDTPQGNRKEWWEPHARINPETEAVELWSRVDYDQDGWETYSHISVTHWKPKPAPPLADGEDTNHVI